jgi:pimeloyl-ACP methyl ester carboxylesterase
MAPKIACVARAGGWIAPGRRGPYLAARTAMEARMRIVSHGDVRIATEAFGDPGDPPLILVMGATASMLGWPDAFCAALAAEGVHVIRFDHRDTGRSTTLPPGAPSYAVEDLAGDVVAILDAHGISRGHLLGMSLGGYLSQMVALTHPGRVASLTLIASEPLGWDGPALPHIAPEIMEHFGGLATLDWTDRAAVAAFLVETERLCTADDGRFDAAAARARAEAVLERTGSPASMFNHATLDVREDWGGRFRDIACPVLVIHGAEDPVLPVENGRALAAGIAGAHLVVLEETGHEIPPGRFGAIAGRVARHVKGAA